MKLTAKVARRLGVDIVVGFTGSKIWPYVAMFPPVPASVIDAGYEDFAEPVESDPRRLRRRRRQVRARGAPERDRLRLLARASGRSRPIDHRAAFGFNWDPSHMMWQNIDPVGFIIDFADRIYHVDCKDTRMRPHNGRDGACSARTCPGATPAAAGTSCRPGTATCPWEDASARSTRSATTGRSPSNGRTPEWTACTAPPRRSSYVRSLLWGMPQAAFDAAFSNQA